MAIKITYVTVNGVRAMNERQLDAARSIKALMEKAGIEGNVEISRFYSDRWYTIAQYERILRNRR